MTQKLFKDQGITGTDYITLNTRWCVACWKCFDNCPENVLGKINLLVRKRVFINKPQACSGCLKCVELCAHEAITIRSDNNTGNGTGFTI
jgi:2-oxoglutarate ferredoxin oxidoreductase subunit delta